MHYLILMAALLSADSGNDKHWSGFAETAVTNNYVVLPGAVVDHNPRLETQLTLRYGDAQSAWYGNIWVSDPLVSRDTKDFGDEVDLSLGYQRTFEQLQLDTKLGYFAFKDLTDIKNDRLVFDLKLTLHHMPVVQPYIKMRYFGELNDHSAPGGFFFLVGASRHQPLGFTLPWSQSEQTLDFGIDTGWSGGAFNKDAGYVYTRLWLSPKVDLSKQWYLQPSASYQWSAASQQGRPSDYADGNQWMFKLAVGFKF